jgi:hypothetical protein
MGAQKNENNPFVFPLQLGSPSADDAIIAGAYFYAHRKAIITGAVVVNGATLAASDTNYVKLALKNASVEVAEIDTRAAHEDGLVADVAKEMNLTDADDITEGVEVAAGSTLTVAYDETDAGTNVALTSAVLIISGYWKETA